MQEGVGEAEVQWVSPPALRQAWPECGHGRRQQEAGLDGQAELSQSYITFGISVFSEAFPPPPAGRRLPFSPICESSPWGPASVFLRLFVSDQAWPCLIFLCCLFHLRLHRLEPDLLSNLGSSTPTLYGLGQVSQRL